MESEKILFIILAIGFSILSMYLKARKKKQASYENSETSYQDFSKQEDLYNASEPMVIFEQKNVYDSPQNFNIYPKKNLKKQKAQKIETIPPPVQNAENIIQNRDLEDKTVLLENFEGTELQKAFLYSEIFKNTKN
jgi:hypothetical protein